MGRQTHFRPQVTVRQVVSLVICASLVSSVFVLNYLSDYGQWTCLKRESSLGHTVPRSTVSPKLLSSEILEAKKLVQSEWRSQTGEMSLTFTSEELGLVDPPGRNVTRRRSAREKIPQLESRIEVLVKARNPCWRTNTTKSGLACVPYFYLAGFPRCGSTDLFRRLTVHPDILRTPYKETQWVTRSRFKSIYGRNESLIRYKGYFGQALLQYWSCERNMSDAIIGDSSASTLWDNSHWQEIPGNANRSEPSVISADVVRHLNRDARIVVIVRNPTDRLYSEYMFFKYNNATKETFHELVLEATQKATECFRWNTIRRCVYHVLNDLTLRIHVGLYSVYIEDWLKRFPRDRLHIVRLEDLKTNTTAVVKKAYAFLGAVNPGNETLQNMAQLPKANPSGRSKELGPMWNETRKILNEFYRPFNQQLAHLLQDPKYEWTDL